MTMICRIEDPFFDIGAAVGTLSTSIFEDLTAAGVPVVAANDLISQIPLAKAGFPWILPAVMGGIIGAIVAGIGGALRAD